MKFEDYTKDQQKAITETGNIIVSAGAGSGKTQVLTERVIHFINNVEESKRLKLNQFLILTFTNLAAGEMKDRIRKALTSVGSSEANEVDYANISTFDSYALALIKKYHFKLGLSSQVAIVDSGIISVRKRTLIEDIFEEYYKEKDVVFEKMIKRFSFKNDDDLRELVFTLYEKSLLQIDTLNYLDNFTANYCNDEMYEIYFNRLDKEVRDLKQDLLNLMDSLTNRPTKNEDEEIPYRDAIYEEFDKFIASNTYEEILSSLNETIETKSPSGLSSKKELDPRIILENKNIKNQIEKFKRRHKKLYEIYSALPKTKRDFFDYYKELTPYIELLIKIVKELDSRINAYKNNYQVYEFQDIAKMALNLVKTDEDIKNSLRNHFKMIMVDEYQDTSELQEAFINEIANNNVYMVGDVKQSIYRFRNAKSDIFIDKYEKYSDKNDNSGKAINLNANFRSRKEVLYDINYIFKQLMILERGGADYQKSHLIEYGNKAYLKAKGEFSNHTDFILYDPDIKYEEKAQMEAKLIAIDIINKINSKYKVFAKDDNGNPVLRDCKYSDFCILMDRGTDFEEYAKVFNEYKLPLFIENDENIAKNNLVLILTNLIKIIKYIKLDDYSSNEFIKSFLSITRSFLYNYSDEKLYEISSNNSYRKDSFIVDLTNIINKNKELSTYKLFKKVIFDLDIYNKCIHLGNVVKNEKYIDMFLEIFESMTKLDYTIDDFILYMEYIDSYNLKITLSSSGSDLDSVKIMNIHKSKGLEFNIVYFSGLYKNFNRMEVKKDFNVSEKYGLFFPPKSPNKINIVNTLYAEDEAKQDLSEKIRLFYVALTRTKEKMIFVLDSPKYYSLSYDLLYKKKDEFIKENTLDSTNKEEARKISFEAFKKEEINNIILYWLSKEIGFKFSYDFWLASNDDKLSYDYFNLCDITDENYINEIQELAEIIEEEEAIDSFEKGLEMLKEGVINIKKFKHIFFELGYILSEDFYNLINEIAIDEIEVQEDWIDEHIYKIMEVKKEEKMEYEDAILRLAYVEDKYAEEFLKLAEIELKSSYTYISSFYKSKDMKINLFPYIANPNYIYDPNESTKRIYNIIKENYLNKTYQVEDCINLLSITNSKYPFIIAFIAKLLELFSQSLISKELKDTIFNYLGFDNNSDLIIKEKQFDLLIEKHENIDLYLIEKLYSLFKKKELTYHCFEELINSLEMYEFNIDFKNLNDEDKLNFKEEDIYDVIVEKGNTDLIDLLSMNFKSFILPFLNYQKFNNVIIDDKSVYLTNDKIVDIEYESLDVEELNLKNNPLHINRASKELNLEVSNKNLEFGSNIHTLLEIIDFTNPNYEIISDKFYKNIIKGFLDSELMKNVNKGEIYKEYEFFDEDNNTRGIIDLMIVYETHIDIIDYKTKHIDDEEYQKQLQVYESFAKRIFKKEVNTYLYSLIDKIYKKCN